MQERFERAAMTASLYTRFVSHALFPLHERFKGHTSSSVRRALEASQWWNSARLRDLQLQRLRALLMHAAARVPYYRDLFVQHGFDPGECRSLSDLTRIPTLTKSCIRANLDGLKAEGSTRLDRFNTGGSSGEPLVFFIGKERVSHDVAAKWRATRWWGVDIGDPEIVVWGSPIELGAQDRLRQLRDRLLRTELLSAFEMSETRLDSYVERIRTRRPAMLFGYPSALTHIARRAETRGIRMDRLGIRVAFVTSERLYDDQRDTIARVFNCNVANGYGGRDAGFVAHECPERGMHITAEDLIVETLDSDGEQVPAGSPGEIAVTHLATRDFPFIRYRTGDVGILDDQPCPCGRGLPLMKEIQGRTTDFLVAADGTIMHGLALIYPMRALPGVAAFKIIQESLDRTRVLVVPGGGYPGDAEAIIQREFRKRLGQGVKVSVERVSAIAPEASGKHRYVISKVDSVGSLGRLTGPETLRVAENS